MGISDLNDEDIELFKRNPLRFLEVPENYNKIFGRIVDGVDARAQDALRFFSRGSDEFLYRVEETK